jgi:copper chaperone CopZ
MLAIASVELRDKACAMARGMCYTMWRLFLCKGVREMRMFLVVVAAVAGLAHAAHAASIVTVQVPDMVCENCAAALTHNFEKQAAVATVATDIPAHAITLTLKDNATLTDAAIRALVVDTGFTPEKISR